MQYILNEREILQSPPKIKIILYFFKLIYSQETKICKKIKLEVICKKISAVASK